MRFEYQASDFVSILGSPLIYLNSDLGLKREPKSSEFRIESTKFIEIQRERYIANELYENRDIPVNTDFRDVLSLILNEHMGISQKELNNIFPNYNLPKQPLPIFG